MADDYLWDRTGPPDAEVERLERLLGRYRHAGRAPSLPLPAPVRIGSSHAAFALLAAAAVLVLIVMPALVVLRTGGGSWEVVRLEGSPTIGSSPVDGTSRLAVGDWLVTDDRSRAEIAIGDIGTVAVEPNTRLRMLGARRLDQRLALARGEISAAIWAPPRIFSVETPSAVAVDLGCVYTLQVDDDGSGLLRVSSGWVAFEHDGRESFVPAGASCRTRPDLGPGTPVYEDASPALRAALATVDTEGDPAARAAALAAVLDQARARDAFTLWHLLPRVGAGERTLVFDRLAALVPPPARVTRTGILGLDRDMLDAWWNELGLEDTAWWRMWKGPLPR